MKRLLILLAGLLYAQPSSADVFNFETPSQNVQCNVGIGDGFADISCTIINRQGPTALPRPANCKSDWGHKFEMNDRGPVKMVCSPLDSSKGAQSVAEYGVTGKFGGFKCLSSKKGFECLNRDKNGFFLSRKKQLIFNSNSSSNAQSAKSSSKDQDCLNTSIRGKEYPFARNRLMKNGWKPKFFSPPFEMAPFADWVQKRNYAEVEACSGTGQALCKFVYESETDKNSLLSVFTAGEDLGIVTGHQCVSAKDMLPELLPQLSNSTSQNSTDTVPTITVKKSWSRDPWDLFYAATLLDYDQLFELRVNCVSNKNANEYNSFYLFFGQDDYSGIATFKFNRDEVYQLKFVDSYSTVDTPEKAAIFEAITAKLKSNNSLSVISFDGNLAKVSLKGSSKAIGECPVRNVVRKSTKGNTSNEQAKSEINAVKTNPSIATEEGVAENTAAGKNIVTQTNTNSGEPKLTRTVSNGIVHHKLDKCDYERGIAIATYSFRTKKPVPPALEYTDVCFDRSNGRIWASEPESRLVLVRKQVMDADTSNNLQNFEVITPNSSNYERWNVATGDYELFGTDIRNGAVDFSYNRPTSKHINWRNTGTQHDANVRLSGYIFETQPAEINTGDEYTFYISGLDNIEHIRGLNVELNRETPIVNWEGSVKFVGKTATVELKDNGDGYSRGNGILTLTKNDDGTISGFGVLKAENTRLAGINPHDWKTTTWTIDNLVGHVTGKFGQQIKAVAIGNGETIDQDGYVNPVLASININGFGSKLTNFWKVGDNKTDNKKSSTTSNSDSSNKLTIEQNLKALDFNPGIADGVFDDATILAINAFQKQYGLPQSDDLSDEQLAVLRALAKVKQK